MSKKKNSKIVVGAIAGVFIVAGVIFVYVQMQTPKTLEEQAYYAAQRGGDYLVRHQHDTGRFDYRYSPETNEVLSGYNMLRHAGTTYALFELYGATDNEQYRLAGERALTYLSETFAPCPPPHKDLVCVYDGEKVKVGGGALAMLAFLEHARTTGSVEYLDTARKLAQWLITVQSSEGEFVTHIQLRDGTIDDHVSEYYPGEAIFALTRLYEETDEEKWLGAATSAAAWLIEVRDKGKTSDDIAHDHWLLYGLRGLYSHAPSGLYVEHAKKIVDGIVKLQHTNVADPSWIGGYYRPPRSTPTATRSEGLAAAHALFLAAEEEQYVARAYSTLERGVQFELRTFIDGHTARTYQTPTRAVGGFRASLEDPEVRIDYVQHNISALLAYHRLATQGE